MSAPVPYSKAEIAFVKRLTERTPRPQIYEMFVRKFGRQDVCWDNFKKFCKRNAFWAAHRGTPTKFSAAELRSLKKGRDLGNADLHERFVKKFDRHDLGVRALYDHALKFGFRRERNEPNEKSVGYEMIRNGFVFVKISDSPIDDPGKEN
jgi:hypothetical protein